MKKKIFVLMLVSMFLLVTLQSISAVETKSGVTVSTDKENAPESCNGDTSRVWGYVCFDKNWFRTVSLYGDGAISTATDRNGMYEFTDVSLGWHEVFCDYLIYYYLAGVTLWVQGKVEFTIDAPGDYQIDIPMEVIDFWAYSSPDTVENIQNLQSSQQQVQNVFSGSQSL